MAEKIKGGRNPRSARSRGDVVFRLSGRRRWRIGLGFFLVRLGRGRCGCSLIVWHEPHCTAKLLPTCSRSSARRPKKRQQCSVRFRL